MNGFWENDIFSILVTIKYDYNGEGHIELTGKGEIIYYNETKFDGEYVSGKPVGWGKYEYEYG